MYNSLNYYKIVFCCVFVWHYLYRINIISSKFCPHVIVIINRNIMIIDTVVKSLMHIMTLGYKMLRSYIGVVMVTIMMMVDTTSSTTESLQVHGSPQLGYYVQLGLGTPYQVVSVFVMLININSSQSNYSTASWWTLVAVTLSLLE